MSIFVKQGHLGGNVRGGDPNTWEPKVWDLLIAHYKPKTLLDVGCGEGHSTKYFLDHGIHAIGVDGAVDNIPHSAGAPIVLHDISVSPFVVSRVDLAWSCEFVEHVVEAAVWNVITTLACGNVVAMTASVTVGGYHHVNLKPCSYWTSLMDAAGFSTNSEFTKACRDVSEHEFFRETGMVFERTTR